MTAHAMHVAPIISPVPDKRVAVSRTRPREHFNVANFPHIMLCAAGRRETSSRIRGRWPHGAALMLYEFLFCWNDAVRLGAVRPRASPPFS